MKPLKQWTAEDVVEVSMATMFVTIAILTVFVVGFLIWLGISTM